MLTQHHWISQIKVNCNVCHQLGNQATREIPKALGTFARSIDAWDRRVQAGQDGAGMSQAVTALGRSRGLQMFARLDRPYRCGRGAAGPAAAAGARAKPRSDDVGLGRTATFAHDELTTDKRNPTANADGPIYGVDWGNDGFLIVDPLEHTATELRIPVLDPKVPPGKAQSMPVPSPYWGEKLYWYDPAITNHAAMDSKGRVWMSSRFRVPENQPAFCATHPSAALAPQPRSFRQIQYFDPRTRQFKQVNICFDVHHVQFARDKDETLYGNGAVQRRHRLGPHPRPRRDRRRGRPRRAGAAAYHDINQDGKVDPKVDREIRTAAGSTASFPIPPTAASGAR